MRCDKKQHDGQTLRQTLAPGRVACLVAASGAVGVNGTLVNARDGVAIRDEDEVRVMARENAELVLVEAAGQALPAPA